MHTHARTLTHLLGSGDGHALLGVWHHLITTWAQEGGLDANIVGVCAHNRSQELARLFVALDQYACLCRLDLDDPLPNNERGAA